MDTEKVKGLIERYWEGDTHRDEEQAIVQFFSEHPVLEPELEQWRRWFSGLQAAASLPDETFDQRILKAIDAKPARKPMLCASLVCRMAVAASMALIVGLGVKQLIPSGSKNRNHDMSEAEVRETVRSLLLLSSSEINRAENAVRQQLETAKVINERLNSQSNE
ncbi:MAG: hypothetical protein AB7C90_09805 [Bacteroidales bacterium]